MGSKNFKKAESVFFILITLFNLIPLISNKFFPTLDGAAHLYNANLIKQLIVDHNENLSHFFVFNTEPVPNWTGHFFLSFFNLFLPAFLADKLLLLFYLIGLPFAFRSLIKTIAPESYLFSYFIFPFTYTFIFFLGFYNFCVGLVLLLLSINYWIRHCKDSFTWKRTLMLFLLVSLTYFSHLFVFAVLVLLIGIQILTAAIISPVKNAVSFSHSIQTALRQSTMILLASILPITLMGYYFYSRQSGTPTFLSSAELTNWIKQIRPMISLNFQEEEPYTKKIYYLITCLFIIAVFNKVNALWDSSKMTFQTRLRHLLKSIFQLSDFWLFSALLMLLLFFKLPDSTVSAGFVSVRLCLLFYLFMVIWLAAQDLPKWLGVLSLLILFYCQFNLKTYYFSAARELNKVAVECNEASNFVPANSLVLPLNYSDNWLESHFSNYLGIDKPMVILENYECGNDYFPLKWNDRFVPNTLFGTIRSGELPCLNWKSNPQNKSQQIDCVFILGNLDGRTDSCSNSIRKNLNDHYTLSYHSDYCRLYQIKK